MQESLMIHNRWRVLALNLCLGIATLTSSFATAADYEKHYGELFMMAGTFCPRGSLPADGRILPIANNDLLFSLIRTKFGGDGRTNFALPNLIGRAPIGQGEGPGLTPRSIGDSDSEGRSDYIVKLPAHTHRVKTASSASRNTHDPNGAYVSTYAPLVKAYKNVTDSSSLDRKFAPKAVSEAGQGSEYSINTQQPVLHVMWCITTHDAVYPSRN